MAATEAHRQKRKMPWALFRRTRILTAGRAAQGQLGTQARSRTRPSWLPASKVAKQPLLVMQQRPPRCQLSIRRRVSAGV